MGDAAGVLIGQDKPYAKAFVDNVQNPFQSRVAAILDPIAGMKSAGTYDYAAAKKAQDSLEAEIAAFEASATEYSGMGSAQKKAVEQAHNTLNPIIENWRKGLEADLAGLPAPAPVEKPALPSATAPTGKDVTPGTTPLKAAQGAADQQRKRAMASQGYGSTILTGPSGVKKGTTPKVQKTILGY